MPRPKHPRRKHYYNPGENPQPQAHNLGHGKVVIAKATRQLRRQARTEPRLAAAIEELDRRTAAHKVGLK